MPPARKPARPDATLAALYKAVLAAPDDDLPRLVYADYLDEHGDPARAEFIRLQCHVAATNPWDEGHADALVRSEVLYERHKEAWGIEELTRELVRTKGVTPGVFNPFVRGFPEITWASIESFSAAHRKALKKYPIRELVLVGGRADGTVELINERSPRVVDLTRVSRAVFLELSDGQPLSSIHTMKLDDIPTIDDAREIAGRGGFAFPNVDALHLIGQRDAGRMRAFVSHLRWPKLTDVTLLGPFTRPVTESLAGAKWLANARRLVVENDEFEDGTPDIAPLFRSPHLRNLRALDVEGFRFDVTAVRAFAASKLGQLNCFRLRPDNSLSPDDYSILLSAPALATVRSLDLPTLDSGAAEVAALIGRNGGLRQLTWGGRQFPAEAVAALANSPASQSLRRWKMRWMSLDGPTVRALLAVPWPNLAELIPEFGRDDGRAVAKLIDHPHFARLTRLDVSTATTGGTTYAGHLWKALAKSETVGRFHKLRLGFLIDDKQLNAVLDNPEVRKIGHLALPQRVKIDRKTQRRYEKVFGVRITRDS